MASDSVSENETSRRGLPWSSQDHQYVMDYIQGIPPEIKLQGSDYDAMSKMLQRTPGAVRLWIFSQAAFGVDSEDPNLKHVIEDKSRVFRIQADDLFRYVVKRYNEKTNGLKSITNSSKDYQTIIAEISDLKDKVDRLTIIVSKLESSLQK